MIEPTREYIEQSPESYPRTEIFGYPVYKWQATPEIFELLEKVISSDMIDNQWYTRTIILNESQVPTESFVKNNPQINYGVIGSLSPDVWAGITVNDLVLIDPEQSKFDVSKLPINQEAGNAKIKFLFSNRSKYVTEFFLTDFPAATELIFTGNPSIEIALPPFNPNLRHPDRLIPDLEFDSVYVPTLENRDFGDVKIQLENNQLLFFSGSSFNTLIVVFAKENTDFHYSAVIRPAMWQAWRSEDRPTKTKFLHLRGVESVAPEGFSGLETELLTLSTNELQTRAFAKSSIEVLELYIPTTLEYDVFEDANIGRVRIVHEEPFDVDSPSWLNFVKLQKELVDRDIPFADKTQ